MAEAVALLILGLLVLLLFVHRMSKGPIPIEESDTSLNWREIAGIVLTPVVLVAAILLAVGFGWDGQVAFTTVFGIALIVATAIRSWPFWDHSAALTLRWLIGDRATTFAYIAIGLGFLYFGYRRGVTIDRFAHECTSLLAAAHDSHQRLEVLEHEYRGTGGIFAAGGLTCGRLAERGKL